MRQGGRLSRKDGPRAAGAGHAHPHKPLPREKFPDLLVGMDDGDDAAVYRLNEHLALIFTLDFFTPIVDDPYDFGSIAAANSMSDVYAMGGDVVLALNICGFPKDMEPAVIGQILRGGADKVIEAGGILSGGHTINDDEPKYGLAVIGFVHPKKVLTKQGAKPGDILVLTKPLGVGIITTALKAGEARTDHVSEATLWMQRLNKQASAVLREAGAHAMTDVTGFALIGHALEIAAHGGYSFAFRRATSRSFRGPPTMPSSGSFRAARWPTGRPMSVTYGSPGTSQRRPYCSSTRPRRRGLLPPYPKTNSARSGRGSPKTAG